MKLILPSIYVLYFLAFQSCQNTITSGNPTETIKSGALNENGYIDKIEAPEEDENNPQEPGIVYPKTGKNATDFLPTLGIYKIQSEVKGDLNKDGKMDIVVVLAHNEVKTAERPMLILLGNEDKSYRLDKVSNLVMPMEYEGDFQMYISQDIRIEKGILQINLFGAGGPVGNIFSQFQYFDNELVLTYVETYDVGAGGWQSLYYDLEKGKLTKEITNTMKEDMPTESKTFRLKKEQHLFESTSPNAVIIEIYRQIEGR